MGQNIGLYQCYQYSKQGSSKKKLVANQLYQHMVDSRLLSPAQSAYRRLHSTFTHSLVIKMIGTVVWIMGSLRILLS